MAQANHCTLTTAFLQMPLFFQNKNYSCAFMLTAIYVTVGLWSAGARGEAREAGAGVAGGLAAVALLGFLFVVAGALAGWVALMVTAPAFALLRPAHPQAGPHRRGGGGAGGRRHAGRASPSAACASA